MSELIFKAMVSYLLGSIVGGLAIGRLRGGVDIRTLGSGNPGGTNALRTQGFMFALGVVLIDVAKGWVAAGVIPGLEVTPVLPVADDAVREWLPVACAAAAITGHVYPVWYGFRGGKGVATLAGALAGIAPMLLVPFAATWLLAAVLFGFVSVASMLAALSLPVAAALAGGMPRVPLVAFGVFAAVTVLFTHRANITRLAAGTEPRARRLWLLGASRR